MLFIGLATTICAGVGLSALGKPSLLLHDPHLAVHDWLLAISIGPSSLADWLMHFELSRYWSSGYGSAIWPHMGCCLRDSFSCDFCQVLMSVYKFCYLFDNACVYLHILPAIQSRRRVFLACRNTRRLKHFNVKWKWSGRYKSWWHLEFRCMTDMFWIRQCQVFWLTKNDFRWSYSTSSPCWRIFWEHCWSSVQSLRSLWRSQGMMEHWLLKRKHWMLQLDASIASQE